VDDKASNFSSLAYIDCDHSFKEKTVSKYWHCQIPLYKERLVYIIKTGRCKNYNNENLLPEEIMNYADADCKI